MKPVTEMGLPVSVENRTGDTPAGKRQRQKLNPPDILLTTPEQVALLLAQSRGGAFLQGFEIHRPRRTAFAGDVEARPYALARPRSPPQACAQSANHRSVGNGSRADGPAEMAGGAGGGGGAACWPGDGRRWRQPDISILNTDEHIPWSGHSANTPSPISIAS